VVGFWAKQTGVKKTAASAITLKQNDINSLPEFPATFHMAASFQPLEIRRDHFHFEAFLVSNVIAGLGCLSR
jgi:hypothetical protein